MSRHCWGERGKPKGAFSRKRCGHPRGANSRSHEWQRDVPLRRRRFLSLGIAYVQATYPGHLQRAGRITRRRARRAKCNPCSSSKSTSKQIASLVSAPSRFSLLTIPNCCWTRPPVSSSSRSAWVIMSDGELRSIIRKLRRASFVASRPELAARRGG